MEVMARRSGDEMFPLAHMARSRSAADEVSGMGAEPDRARRLRVVGEQRRPYQVGHSRTRNKRDARNISPSGQGSPTDVGNDQ